MSEEGTFLWAPDIFNKKKFSGREVNWLNLRLLPAAGLGGMGSVSGYHALGIGAGLVGLVIMVIVGGVAGFISGAIVVIIYNIVLGAMGGIELDLEVKT
jgi:hypothetical protein